MGDEMDFTDRLFAFENMFETDQNSKNNEKRLGRELPKGVL